MSGGWDPTGCGVLVLPSGRAVRGRALRRALPAGPLRDFALYLLASEPDATPWPHAWLRWPDFGLPADPVAARAAFETIWTRAEYARVEVACGGGRGRTGTALACVAVLDGMTAGAAVAHVRRHYRPRAVETPWQRRYVQAFAGGA